MSRTELTSMLDNTVTLVNQMNEQLAGLSKHPVEQNRAVEGIIHALDEKIIEISQQVLPSVETFGAESTDTINGRCTLISNGLTNVQHQSNKVLEDIDDRLRINTKLGEIATAVKNVQNLINGSAQSPNSSLTGNEISANDALVTYDDTAVVPYEGEVEEKDVQSLVEYNEADAVLNSPFMVCLTAMLGVLKEIKDSLPVVCTKEQALKVRKTFREELLRHAEHLSHDFKHSSSVNVDTLKEATTQFRTALAIVAEMIDQSFDRAEDKKMIQQRIQQIIKKMPAALVNA